MFNFIHNRLFLKTKHKSKDKYEHVILKKTQNRITPSSDTIY